MDIADDVLDARVLPPGQPPLYVALDGGTIDLAPLVWTLLQAARGPPSRDIAVLARVHI